MSLSLPRDNNESITYFQQTLILYIQKNIATSARVRDSIYIVYIDSEEGEELGSAYQHVMLENVTSTWSQHQHRQLRNWLNSCNHI